MTTERVIDYKLPADALVGLEAYHAARRERRLLVPHCRGCGEAHWYPRPFCPFCFGTGLDWPEARGGGVIYSFSIMRRAPVPYAIGFVTLAEGPVMMTNLVDSPFEALAIGRAVGLRYQDSAEGEPYPVFGLR